MKFSNKLIFIGFVFSFLLAGTDGTVRGKITDQKGDPLPGQVVVLNELGDVVTGTAADFDGNYIILNIQVGTYDISCTMIGFKGQRIKDVSVSRDQTLFLDFVLEESVIEGEEIVVSSQKALVEKGTTSKKITVSQEAIEALPIRNVTELYSLQSGVVKVERGQQGAIPDMEEKGLEEVHVRGGRTGEIAYMIDGLYIRNPIYGGIGNGTRLNLFAVREFDWQPGGFNAEYGDAMSAVSNMHTNSGQDKFRYKFQYETGPGSTEYDRLKGYQDYNMGFGGKIPLIDLYYWVSGQSTSHDAYSIYEFDNLTHIENDPSNLENIENIVAPWDNESGFRAFGFDRTEDVYVKLNYDVSSNLKFNVSYWEVHGHLKGFNSQFLYFDEGKNELFRDSERYTFEANHTLKGGKTFYTVRYSQFIQDQFIGSRWRDNDSDGYPNWFEYKYNAGKSFAGFSDPNNPYVVPHSISSNEDSLFYTRVDGTGPENWTSGWYYGSEPGNYNWNSAEDFYDLNNDGVYTEGVDGFDLSVHDTDQSGGWTAPALAEAATYRDGSYWLLPEMYVDPSEFGDAEAYLNFLFLDPYYNMHPDCSSPYACLDDDLSPQGYSNPYYGNLEEGYSFGGHDSFYSESKIKTNEIRFDITSQLTGKWRARWGVDVKSHKLNFYEVKYPWLQGEAKRQRFAEQWDDYGRDGIPWIEFEGDVFVDLNDNNLFDDNEELTVDYDGDGYYDPPLSADEGESNGKWDFGEAYDDFNGDNKWNSYVEPMEAAIYWQNTFEVPWMVINAGVRVDGVNYNTKVWSTPNGEYSATRPWFWSDCGTDNICPGEVGVSYPGPDDDGTEDNGAWDLGEDTGTEFGMPNSRVFFKDSEWLYKISPRLGFSHVITDQSTFTFNYGLYYQTPIYDSVYRNTSQQEDPETALEESDGEIGNATMTAQRTQSYEFGFNVQVGQSWAYSIMGWVKDMDQMVTARPYSAGFYDYYVQENGSFGSAKGIDVTLENRGQLINTMIQYTYSVAKANESYASEAFGGEFVDSPMQESIMPFDRTHDLTVTLYSFLPFGINASLTGFYQSGFPYTPEIMYEQGAPQSDVLNPNSQRSSAYQSINLSLSKDLKYKEYSVALGINVYNLFDNRNEVSLYPLTGNADYAGDYYMQDVGFETGEDKSSAYYDRPWYYSSPREINFFMRIDFR